VSEAFIVEVDAAETPLVDGELLQPLLAFARDLTRYAATTDERDLRRALCSPFSGVSNVDARALCTVAGERRGVAQTIERERVVLDRPSALATRRFVRAMSEIERAYRAQGATATEHVATMRLAFGLDAMGAAAEGATLCAIAGLALRLDAERQPGHPWDATAFADALESLAVASGATKGRPSALVPLPAREPEARHVVKRRRGHFSASSLGAFAECERRWYYRYVCSAVEDRGSSASFYGTAFHWALERFHGEFPRADAADPGLLERKLDAYLGTSFERYRSGFETNVEYELQRRRAKRTGRRYLTWFLARARAHPFAVIGTEATVELELDGYTFIGYIDRLDRDDETGAVTVVDYKTGTIAQSAQEYRDKVARFIDFQLPFYYWARTAAGDRVTRLALVPLKDASRDVEPVELEVVPVGAPRSYSDATVGTIGLDELERARVRMIEIAAELADGPIERFSVTEDPGACIYCAYKIACRDRPLPREDRFGR
jgi:RecB family exonuclease